MVTKDIRMDSDDGALLAMLVQFQEIPIESKLELIMEMSPDYRVLGQVAANIDREFVFKKLSKDQKKAVHRLELWAASNRRPRKKKRG